MNMNETSQATEDPQSQGTDPAANLRAAVEDANLALKMKKEELEKISAQVSDGFEADLKTRESWEKNLDEWTNLALQVKEQKTWPWQNASNVKYPLLSTAAMQFNARSYPSLVPSTGDIVKLEVIGKDQDDTKHDKAQRIGTYMSYQLLNEMDGWEEDMDRLLIMLPIVGTLFKKTYYCPVKKHNMSDLVLPKNLVVNYWTKCLEDSERVSEIIEMSPRLVKERQMSGDWRDDELGDPQLIDKNTGNAPVTQDETIPYTIIEQHTYLDLDKDGYAEPYIVTFERFSRVVLCVRARFDDKGIYLAKDGKKIAKICPIQYYTKFSFIPNPNGSFYDIGFGLLLSPLNEAVNSLINQLIDAGTLSNLQGGFLGKGIKLKMGESRWAPGEWKTINSTADDLRKQVVPLPTKEPSKVLFELMGTLVTSGKELASVAEIFVGKMPGQNTPATTTMATIEQGMKVFTAVYKRVYRSLKSEFKKLFDLNATYLDPYKYQAIVDADVSPEDFDNTTYDVCPSADPATATQTEKLMKAQGLLELLPLGTLDPVAVTMRVLEAQEQPNYQQVLSQEIQQTGQHTPPQDPKMQEMQMKSQIEQQKAQMDMQQKQFQSELDARDSQMKLMMQAQEHAQEMRHKEMMMKMEAALELHKQRIFMAGEQQKVQQQAQMHQQTLRQNEETHQSKQKLMAKQASSKPSATGKTTK